MTANDIFKLGLSLIQEKVGEDPDTSYYTPMFLNIALAETFENENLYRAAKGMDELSEIPTITALTDTVGYVNPKLLTIALPYALCAHYFRDNNDVTHEQMFRQEYVSAVMDATPFYIGTVTDVYGGAY